MQRRLEITLTVVLTVCALGVATSSVYQAFFSNTRTASVEEPDFIESWEDALDIGLHLGGDYGAPVKVIVLTDLECPACRGFHSTLQALVAERAEDVQVVYVALPLEYHRFAQPAALAAECAQGLGAFSAFVDAIFAKQDSLGVKSWEGYAADAGISDTTSFVACTQRKSSSDRIDAGRAFGDRIKFSGTPTVIVNGWRYPRVPSKDDLMRSIGAIVAGEQPT